MDRDTAHLFCKLKERFSAAVAGNRGEGILFSGGLDSALVAACAGKCAAISVHLCSYGEDRRYASKVASFFELDHHPVTVTVEEALAALPEVIRIRRSFDPALPNDVTVYLGIRRAKEIGIRSMMTGDGSDELFAGYDFMRGIPDLAGYLNRMHAHMNFSSNAIGSALGVAIRQPFLDPSFVDFSHAIDLSLKIREEGGGTLGQMDTEEGLRGCAPAGDPLAGQTARGIRFRDDPSARHYRIPGIG